MCLEIQLASSAIGYVGVELRRREVRMPEHLLDAPQVGTALEQVRGERVPEEMRVDPLGLEPGLRSQPAQDQERACPREGAAAGVQEEVGPVAAVEVGSPARQIAAYRLGGAAADRDDPLLPALADAADEPSVEVDGPLLEAHRLADPEARAVEELDERAVAVDPVTGHSIVTKDELVPDGVGTTVEIKLLLFDGSESQPAQLAITIAKLGQVYAGPSRPSWYGLRAVSVLFADVVPDTANVGDVLRDVFEINRETDAAPAI
jgi:hypothetical protein